MTLTFIYSRGTLQMFQLFQQLIYTLYYNNYNNDYYNNYRDAIYNFVSGALESLKCRLLRLLLRSRRTVAEILLHVEINLVLNLPIELNDNYFYNNYNNNQF